MGHDINCFNGPGRNPVMVNYCSLETGPFGCRNHDFTDDPFKIIPMHIGQDRQVGVNLVEPGKGVYFDKIGNPVPVNPDIDPAAIPAAQSSP